MLFVRIPSLALTAKSLCPALTGEDVGPGTGAPRSVDTPSGRPHPHPGRRPC